MHNENEDPIDTLSDWPWVVAVVLIAVAGFAIAHFCF